MQESIGATRTGRLFDRAVSWPSALGAIACVTLADSRPDRPASPPRRGCPFVARRSEGARMPSTLLVARRISRHHGARTLLDAVDLRVDAGSRIALIGPNGSGKSTLLRILAGLEPADGGTVRAHGTVGYLPQLATETAAAGNATARATILERIRVAA